MQIPPTYTNSAEYKAWLYLNSLTGAFDIGNYNAGLVTEPQPNIVGVKGGFSGTAESVRGILDYHKNDNTIALDFTHSGFLQSTPYYAAKLLSRYTHSDKSLKIVWAHSMGADAAAIAYGNGLTYYNLPNTNLPRPELVKRIKQNNHEFSINTFGQAERLHELNLVMGRVDLILENLDNMAKHADTVNIFMLREDEREKITRYGDRSYEGLITSLNSKELPNNVNIIEIKNFSKTKYHAGALEENSLVLKQIFEQYKEIQNKEINK